MVRALYSVNRFAQQCIPMARRRVNKKISLYKFRLPWGPCYLDVHLPLPLPLSPSPPLPLVSLSPPSCLPKKLKGKCLLLLPSLLLPPSFPPSHFLILDGREQSGSGQASLFYTSSSPHYSLVGDCVHRLYPATGHTHTKPHPRHLLLSATNAHACTHTTYVHTHPSLASINIKWPIYRDATAWLQMHRYSN